MQLIYHIKHKKHIKYVVVNLICQWHWNSHFWFTEFFHLQYNTYPFTWCPGKSSTSQSTHKHQIVHWQLFWVVSILSIVCNLQHTFTWDQWTERLLMRSFKFFLHQSQDKSSTSFVNVASTKLDDKSKVQFSEGFMKSMNSETWPWIPNKISWC